MVSGKPGFKGRGVIMRREQKKRQIRFGGFSGGYHLMGIVPGGGRGKRRRRVWGLHTLFRLFTGKWILKNKSPATHHLCLWKTTVASISHRQSLGSCLCYVCLFVSGSQKGSTLEHSTRHLVRFLLVLHQRCGKARCFLEWEFLDGFPTFTQPLSFPHLTKTPSEAWWTGGLLNSSVHTPASGSINQQPLCIHQHLSERTSLAFRRPERFKIRDLFPILAIPDQQIPMLVSFSFLFSFFSIFPEHRCLPSIFFSFSWEPLAIQHSIVIPFLILLTELHHGGNLSLKHSALRFIMLKSELIFYKKQEYRNDIIVGQCWFRLCLLWDVRDRLRRVAVTFLPPPGSGVILRSWSSGI